MFYSPLRYPGRKGKFAPVIEKIIDQRIHDKEQIILGEKLSLKQGDVNNLYRDICDLYSYWLNYKDAKDSNKKPSPTFPFLIRMSLWVIAQTLDLSVLVGKILLLNHGK